MNSTYTRKKTVELICFSFIFDRWKEKPLLVSSEIYNSKKLFDVFKNILKESGKNLKSFIYYVPTH